MKKHLYLYAIIMLLVGIFGFFAASVYVAHENNLNISKSTVMEMARIYAGLFNDDIDLDEFVGVADNTRITIVSAEGLVLADNRPSDSQLTDNYLTRPEIQAAAQGVPEIHVRHSATHGSDFIYYALKVDAADSFVFVRASVPVAQIEAYVMQSIPLLLSLLAAFALICFFLVHRVTNRILKPFNDIEQKLTLLSDGTFTSETTADSYVEINNITGKIDGIATVLQNNFDTLRDERNKLTYILNSIGDGLFVIGRDMEITGVNLAALELFSAESDIADKKLSHLTSDKTLTAAIESCVKHSQGTLFELSLNSKTYLVTIKRLPDTKSTMVMMADITEKHENAKRREEFFANASHELKTPLTAIRGFNELTYLNNKDEGISKYIDSITRETNRMMSLIADMLKLSELESTTETIPVLVSLSEIVSEVSETVSVAFAEKSITFEITGAATVKAESRHVYDIVKNLVENAARYNSNNGKVSIKIESTKKVTRMTVSDTGIGISPQEQTKIFERFYRVEKSRSIQSGGTGLGLAIVKHTCALYGWKLSLKSKLGVGTDIIVDFI